jgi:hypothetical protein
VDGIVAAYMMASATALSPVIDRPPVIEKPMVSLRPSPGNWCTKGYQVMVPDGRQGLVTSVSGDLCRVLADGEAYVTQIPYFIVEPVYPQPFKTADIGH